MIQVVFLTLLIVALLAGALTYFSPSPKPIRPLHYLMEDTGYDAMDTSNKKSTQQINMKTDKGIIQMRAEMENISLAQNKFLDTLEDQQQILSNAGKGISDLIMETQQEGAPDNSRDVLQLKTVVAQMQDEQRLLIANGQQLVGLNAQLTKNRQWVADQINYANIITNDAMRTLQNRNDTIKVQAAEFFDKMYAYHQEMRDRMARMRQQLNDLANAGYENKAREKMIKGHIQQMLQKTHEDMRKLDVIQENNKDLFE